MSHNPALGTQDVPIFGTGTSPVSKHVDADSCREGLREAGTRRALADRLRADAMVDLADWIRAAKEQGVPVTEIARLAGVTRQTVYDILNHEKRGKP